jgi:hypothetical protein
MWFLIFGIAVAPQTGLHDVRAANPKSAKAGTSEAFSYPISGRLQIQVQRLFCQASPGAFERNPGVLYSVVRGFHHVAYQIMHRDGLRGFPGRRVACVGHDETPQPHKAGAHKRL